MVGRKCFLLTFSRASATTRASSTLMGDLALSRILSAFSSRVRADTLCLWTAGVLCLVLVAVREMAFERNRVGELLVSTVAMAKVLV